jgi:hypothetical protein
MTLHAKIFGDERTESSAPATQGQESYYELFRTFNSEGAFFDFARTLREQVYRPTAGAIVTR